MGFWAPDHSGLDGIGFASETGVANEFRGRARRGELVGVCDLLEIIVSLVFEMGPAHLATWASWA